MVGENKVLEFEREVKEVADSIRDIAFDISNSSQTLTNQSPHDLYNS